MNPACWLWLSSSLSTRRRSDLSASTWVSESASTYGERMRMAWPSTWRCSSGHSSPTMRSTHLRVSSISPNTFSLRSSRSSSARYILAMRSSVLAIDISMLSMNVENSGHSLYA